MIDRQQHDDGRRRRRHAAEVGRLPLAACRRRCAALKRASRSAEASAKIITQIQPSAFQIAEAPVEDQESRRDAEVHEVGEAVEFGAEARRRLQQPRDAAVDAVETAPRTRWPPAPDRSGLRSPMRIEVRPAQRPSSVKKFGTSMRTGTCRWRNSDARRRRRVSVSSGWFIGSMAGLLRSIVHATCCGVANRPSAVARFALRLRRVKIGQNRLACNARCPTLTRAILPGGR